MISNNFFSAADDRRKNRLAKGNAGYSSDIIEEPVQNQMDIILHRWMQPDEIPSPLPLASAADEPANSAITMEQIRVGMMKVGDNILCKVTETSTNERKLTIRHLSKARLTAKTYTIVGLMALPKIHGTTAQPTIVQKKVTKRKQRSTIGQETAMNASNHTTAVPPEKEGARNTGRSQST